jgi:hypothetical protein
MHKQETGDTGMSGERFGAFVRREREAKEIEHPEGLLGVRVVD